MPLAPDDIHANHSHVLERIAAAAKRAGRDDIPTLVAVTKTQEPDALEAILATGQTVFGENRVQEAQSHWAEHPRRDDLTLHLIGPLQSNKSRDAVALFDVIETLDRPKLAKTIASAAQELGRLPELFVQVNTGEEPQKSGVLPDDLEGFLKTVRRDYDLHPTGLMCIPPLAASTGQAAGAHFWLLRTLAERNGLSKLSMGMSADYETAVELGATHVRVGSGIFGPRG